jgi:hypothetical protein
MIIVGWTDRHPPRWLFAPVEVACDFCGIHYFTPLADFILFASSKAQKAPLSAAPFALENV